MLVVLKGQPDPRGDFFQRHDFLPRAQSRY
jgi:hypothetical protein